MRSMAVVVLVALLASCGGDDDDVVDDTSVVRDRAIPAELQAFLDEVPDHGATSFTATYSVLKRFGGEQSTVQVASDPPRVTIEVGALRVITGPEPQTCEEDSCEDFVDEARLSATGIFSTFTTTGPKQAIEATATRADAGDPVFSERTVAETALRCVEVPVQEVTPSTWCTTSDGIFGFVDTPAVLYELTEYSTS